MKKILYLIPIVILVAVFAISGFISATMMIPAADQAKENAKAPEKSPVIGENWGLVRVDFVHYAKPTNPARPPKTVTCYKLMGVKWTSLPVSYIINPINEDGLSENFVTSAISISVETWDDATSTELFKDAYTVDYNVKYGVQDFKNAIDFGDYPQDGVIAVTSVWYTRVGKKIVEFDIRFDTDFAWGNATENSSLMDLQNIATHELGHAVGLNDIYSSSCNLVTMYGYSSEGETIKRTLEPADITGLQKMYGN